MAVANGFSFLCVCVYPSSILRGWSTRGSSLYHTTLDHLSGPMNMALRTLVLASLMQQAVMQTETCIEPTPDARFPLLANDPAAFEAVCGGNHLRMYGEHLQRMASGDEPPPARVLHLKGPRKSEGVADFMNQAVSALASAVANGDGLYIEWEGVQLADILTPVPGGIDWSDARLLQLCASSVCLDAGPLLLKRWSVGTVARSKEMLAEARAAVAKGDFFAAVPLRAPYGGNLGHPGKEVLLTSPMALEYAAACLLGALFMPAARPQRAPASDFGVQMQQLADPKTLSISIYIRTYRSQRVLSKSKLDQLSRDEWTDEQRKAYAGTMRCATQLEALYATDTFDHVVWFVASDGVDVRRAAQHDYDQEASGGRRRVLVTKGTGRHTAPEVWQRKDSLDSLGAEVLTEARHAAAAEALADWWLLGEADVSVIGSFGGDSETFARTALSRTARNASVAVVSPTCKPSEVAHASPWAEPDSTPRRCKWSCSLVPMWNGEPTRVSKLLKEQRRLHKAPAGHAE
jgi:hypothetical protein